MSLDRTGTNTSNMPLAIRFFIRRAFRIYPLSILTVLICYIFSPQVLGFRPSELDLTNSLILTQNITGTKSIPGTLWSLPFEIQMYTVLPGIYMIMKSQSWRGSLLALTVLSCAIPLLLWKSNYPYCILSFTPCFLGGAIGFAIKHNMTIKVQKVEFKPYLISIAALSISFSLAAISS